MSVEECQDKVDSEEFTFWRAKYDRDPWGPKRMDVGFALICQTLWGVKNIKTKLSDFIPEYDREETPRELKQAEIAHRLMTIFGAAATGKGK